MLRWVGGWLKVGIMLVLVMMVCGDGSNCQYYDNNI